MEQQKTIKKSILVLIIIAIMLAGSTVAYAVSVENMGTLADSGNVVAVNSEQTPVDRNNIVQKMERGQIEGSATFYTVDRNGISGIAIFDDVRN